MKKAKQASKQSGKFQGKDCCRAFNLALSLILQLSRFLSPPPVIPLTSALLCTFLDFRVVREMPSTSMPLGREAMKSELGRTGSGEAKRDGAEGSKGSRRSAAALNAFPESNRRVVSAVPRTDVVIPWFENQFELRARRTADKERVGENKPHKPLNTRTGRAGIRSAQTDERKLKANAPSAARSSALEQEKVFQDLPQEGRDDSEQVHPWSWIRDFPRPPSRQRHPTQSLHLGEPL
eukprot:758707-Hanusia_phi.AAC.13